MAKKPVVVVTGSSTGIGLNLCLSLSRRDYTVVATLRTPSAAPECLRASNCDIQPLDVTNDTSAASLCEYVRSRYSGCDVLVNNAGWGMPGTLETWSIEEAKKVFEVNVWGAVRMCQVLVPFMRARGGGLVVTVSSTSGWRGLPCSDVYASSKHAIEGMMDCFRYSVQKDNIKVCIVNPGPTNTLFSKRFQSELIPSKRAEAETPTLPMRLTEHYVEAMARRNSAGQSPEDCAEAIAEVIGRELPKKIDDGAERATFWNPTSDYGMHVLENTRVFKDGASGPEYNLNFKQSFDMLDKLQREEKSKGEL